MKSYLESLDSAFLAHFSRRLSDLIIEQSTKLLEKHGISAPTTAVSTIYFLAENEQATVADLAEALSVTHQMATQRSNTLEKMGLIYRKPNPNDKREKTIHLTQLGMDECLKLRPLIQELSAVFDELNLQLECELMKKVRRAELALIEKPLLERLEELRES